MKSALTPLLILVLGFTLESLTAQAVPSFINYQGFVTDVNGVGIGNSAPENRKIIFRIYDDANAGNRLWTEEHTVTLVNGQFSILLGNGIDATGTASGESRPSIDSIFGGSGGERYIGITVDNGDNVINGSDSEIAPRQRITSTAYSLRAATADRVVAGSDLYLTSNSNHGLGWYGSGRQFNGIDIDGPVLYGSSGGALGSVNGSTQTTSLRWDSSGNLTASNNLSVTGTLNSTGNATLGGTLGVTGMLTAGSELRVDGVLRPRGGIQFRNAFNPGTSYVGTPGNYLSFGHAGASEDYIGYKSNTFYFKDSPDGGDSAQPNVVVGGKLSVGGDAISGGAIMNVHGPIHASGHDTTTGRAQGAYLEWSRATDGRTYIVNHRGLGGGGIAFGEIDPADNTSYTETMGITRLGDLTVSGGATLGGNLRISDKHLMLRGSTDANHGLGWQQSFNSTNIDGPVLYGYGGGALGTRDSLSNSDKVVLQWKNNGTVEIGGKPATVGEENLRIVRGTIELTGSGATVLYGSGFTVERISGGRVKITLSVAFSSAPSVTATIGASDTPDFVDHCNVYTIKADSFNISVQDGGGGERDRNFCFIAVGPR